MEQTVLRRLLFPLFMLSIFHAHVICLKVVVPDTFRDPYGIIGLSWSFGGGQYYGARQALEFSGHTVTLVSELNNSTLYDQDVLFTGAMKENNEESAIMEWVKEGHVAYLMCDEPNHSYCSSIPGITPQQCDGSCRKDWWVFGRDEVYIPDPPHPIVDSLSDNPEFVNDRVRFSISTNASVVATYKDDEKDAAIVDVELGKGRVILIGDATVFINDQMIKQSTRQLLQKAMEYAEEVINEFVPVNRTEPRKIDIVIDEDILVIIPTEISGGLNVTNSTLTVTDDATITVSGCLDSQDGTLLVKIGTPPKDGEKRDLLEYNCLTSEFSTIHTVSEDNCKNVTIGSSEYTETTLSVVFAVKDICQENLVGGIRWWGALIIVFGVIAIVIIITAVVYYVKPLRRTVMPFKREKTQNAREIDI